MQESRQEQDRKTEAKRNLSTLKRSQENAISGKRKDSAQEKTHDVSVTMRTNVTNTRDRLLLLQSRRRKAVEKFFDNKNSQRSEYIWEEISKTAQRLHQREMYEHLMSLLASSGVSKLQTEWRCKFSEKCAFTHRGNGSQHRKKSQNRLVVLNLLPYWRIPGNLFASSRKSSRWNPIRFYGRTQNPCEHSAACNSQKGTLRQVKIREKRIRRKVRFSTLDLMTAVSILKNMRTDLKRKLWSKNDASAETRGKWQKDIFKLKDKDTATFCSLQKFGREFVEDFGSQCTCWTGKIWIQLNWRLFEYPEIQQRILQSIEKCRQMRKQQCTSTVLIYSRQYRSSRIRQFYHLENSANITDTPMSGPVVKNHIKFKTVKGASVTSWSYDMDRHAKRCVERCRQREQSSNCISSPHHVLTTIWKEDWKRWEICQTSGLKLSWNSSIWHVLVDRTSYGRWTN